MSKERIISKLIGNFLQDQVEKEYITVAELRSTVNGKVSKIDTNTALIPESLIPKIKATCINPFVERTGVNYDKDYIYKPSFWLNLSKSPGLRRAEPLVVSWCSGNHTTLNIDQGFLSTYELSPRLLKEEICWDDLKKPEYGVVINKQLSEYSFPHHSEAYVKIKKEYFQDYLELRKKMAVQIFSIERDLIIDDDIALLLGNKGSFRLEQNQYYIRITRPDHRQDEVRLEINAYRILFQDDRGGIPENKIAGHYWKGIDGLVTQWRARHEMLHEYVYVSDEVLVRFEGDDDYEVYPKTGRVAYRNQWSVSFCERIGRNAIRIELKKLYEGNRADIIDHWNEFSIDKSEVVEGMNISACAERLVKRYFLFGRLFTSLINQLFNFEFRPNEIIGLDEDSIEYTGWMDFREYKAVTHHINLKSFSKDQFLARCKKLYILLGETLKEKPLRKIVDSVGFPCKSHNLSANNTSIQRSW